MIEQPPKAMSHAMQSMGRAGLFLVLLALLSHASVSAQKPAPEAKDEAAPQKLKLEPLTKAQRELWVRNLTSAPESSRWFVGYNFGRSLSALPGDSSFEVLQSCWTQIAPSVRCQILKGFQPSMKKSPGINDRFFDVMNLGYTDSHERVRQFATVYLKAILIPDVASDKETWDRWYQKHRTRPAGEVLVEQATQFAMSLKKLPKDRIPAALEKLAEAGGNLRAFPAMREAAIKAGLYEVIDGWVKSGIISEDDDRLQDALAKIPRERPAEQVIGELLEHWKTVAGTGNFDRRFDRLISELSRSRDARLIPALIGIIDADNSYSTVYGVGYFGLRHITGVSYSRFHDGAWWRRWWRQNQDRFGEKVAALAIPELPKTKHGREHTPFPAELDTVNGKLNWIVKQFRDGDIRNLSDTAGEIGDHKDPIAIPTLIGLIEADNSYHTVYGVGYFGLGPITQISYSPFHDGAWWRRWWEANRSRYPVRVRTLKIPVFAKTEHGRNHVPFPAELDTLDGKLKWIVEQFVKGERHNLARTASEIADHGDPKAIPTLLGLIDVAEDQNAVAWLRTGLPRVKGVDDYPEEPDAKLLREWWKKNRVRLPAEVRDMPILDFRTQASLRRKVIQKKRERELAAEFEGFTSVEQHIGDDKRKQYFLMTPPEGHPVPLKGWKLILILPGGDGSAGFEPFCRRIHKSALPKGYLAAQLVAHRWSDDKNRVVWPNHRLNPDNAEFTTEEFIREVVADVKKQTRIDSRYVFTLSWSSSGPSCYSASMEEDRVVTGSFVAMSVFRPQLLPGLKAARGHAYYLLHSPQDFIPIDQHARLAEKELRAAGAKTKLQTYRGGHGWREDPFGHIRRGVVWLEEQMKPQ